MMRLAAILLLSLAILPLAGCWSAMELTELGFVQAAAIDLADDGAVELTVQIYKPGSQGEQSQQSNAQSSYINVSTTSTTILGATGDIMLKLGRKPQWSHMSALLISDELARTRNIGQYLDFFSRRNEPRGSVSVLVTGGKAQDYLRLKPFIEGTIGQQLRSIESISSRYVGKTDEVSLTDLIIRSKSEVPLSAVPYYAFQESGESAAAITGMAVIRFPEGVMTGIVPAADTPYYLILTNRYKQGNLDLPCPGKPGKSDSLMITKSSVKLRPAINESNVRFNISVQLEVYLGELTCGQAITEADIDRFVRRAESKLAARFDDTVEQLQERKADILGIGLKLSREHPRIWKKLRGDWPDQFAGMDLNIRVKVKVLSTGSDVGEPFDRR